MKVLVTYRLSFNLPWVVFVKKLIYTWTSWAQSTSSTRQITNFNARWYAFGNVRSYPSWIPNILCWRYWARIWSCILAMEPDEEPPWMVGQENMALSWWVGIGGSKRRLQSTGLWSSPPIGPTHLGRRNHQFRKKETWNHKDKLWQQTWARGLFKHSFIYLKIPSHFDQDPAHPGHSYHCWVESCRNPRIPAGLFSKLLKQVFHWWWWFMMVGNDKLAFQIVLPAGSNAKTGWPMVHKSPQAVWV